MGSPMPPENHIVVEAQVYHPTVSRKKHACVRHVHMEHPDAHTPRQGRPTRSQDLAKSPHYCIVAFARIHVELVAACNTRNEAKCM